MALVLAQRTAFSEHRTPAVLVLWVDFYIELGRLDDALELAAQLVNVWPEHPLPHLKLSQCLAWLDLRADEEAALIAAADRLERFPKASAIVLRRFARYNLFGARSRVAAALSNPTFSEVWPELSSLSHDLSGSDR
jgi:hypothetical protein